MSHLTKILINKRGFYNLERAISRFWDIEKPPNSDKLFRFSEEEKMCMEHFRKNTIRDANGRIVIALPFRKNKNSLGSSRKVALKRLLSLRRRFQRDPKFEREYTSVIQGHIDLGHMQKVPEYPGERAYHHPHHAVFKESSNTTKTRVVMDGSAESDTGISLNDTLMVGLTLQDTIFALYLRFRLHK